MFEAAIERCTVIDMASSLSNHAPSDSDPKYGVGICISTACALSFSTFGFSTSTCSCTVRTIRNIRIRAIRSLALQITTQSAQSARRRHGRYSDGLDLNVLMKDVCLGLGTTTYTSATTM